jgi:hypothetical protein
VVLKDQRIWIKPREFRWEKKQSQQGSAKSEERGDLPRIALRAPTEEMDDTQGQGTGDMRGDEAPNGVRQRPTFIRLPNDRMENREWMRSVF